MSLTEDNMIVPKDKVEQERTKTPKEVVASTLQDPSVQAPIEESSWAEMKRDGDDDVSLFRQASNGINALTSNLTEIPAIVKAPAELVTPIKKDEGSTVRKNTCDDHIAFNFAPYHNDEKGSSLNNTSPDIGKFGSLVNLPSPQSFPPNNLPRLNSAGDYMNRHHSAIEVSELSKHNRRVAKLEHDLAEANRKLVEERHAHNKMLRQEKERYENLMQALQLRLYISENKLRTYEEALEKHIQAVSAISSSAVGGVTRKSNGEERIPSSSSLISKVLGKSE